MKVSDLKGLELDFQVARAEDHKIVRSKNKIFIGRLPWLNYVFWGHGGTDYSPSTRWSQGGPIIEKEGIFLAVATTNNGKPTLWSAEIPLSCDEFDMGPTPLIAAMRVYIRSEFGDTVKVVNESFET